MLAGFPEERATPHCCQAENLTYDLENDPFEDVRQTPISAVPLDDVPHKIERGQVSEYDGWILPTPLFNRLTPCFGGEQQTTPVPKRGAHSGQAAKRGSMIFVAKRSQATLLGASRVIVAVQKFKAEK